MNKTYELEFIGNNIQKYELESSIVKVKPETESIDITPSKDAQSFQGLYDSVRVSGDNNLTAENIKKDVSIFGVEGSYEPEIRLQNKSTSITENGTQTIGVDSDYDGLSNVEVTVNVEGKPNMIYSKTGYNNDGAFYRCVEELKDIDASNFVTVNSIFSGWYSLKKVSFKKDTILPKSAFTNAFYNCKNLLSAPEVNTSKITGFQNTFANCEKLAYIPIYDVSSCAGIFTLYNTFQGCSSLTEESLNNVMQICINATNKIRAKSYMTLKTARLTQTQAETCMTLSNYQAFLDAGWTTGY